MSPARCDVEGHLSELLDEGWELAAAPPDEASVGDLASLRWMPARVPGTAAGALRDAGLWRPGQAYDFDGQDWWFRTRFRAEPPAPSEQLWLCLDGLATIADVYLNGAPVLQSSSMFAPQRADVGGMIAAENELLICCRALAPLLAAQRRPRARWRTRLVSDGALRFHRTMLLGRAPGFAPGPPTVGPWRPVRLLRERGIAVEQLTLRPRVREGETALELALRLRPLDDAAPERVEVELEGPSGSHRATLPLQAEPTGELSAVATIDVAGAARWWPHSHGAPSLYDVHLRIEGPSAATAIDAGRVGFRELAPGPGPGQDLERDGIRLHLNGVPVFARGAVWTPADIVSMAPTASELRRRLTLARDGGMNMLRIPGTAAYEDVVFHDLCDELGIMVWQDFMFANLDYPIADESFRATVTAEARSVLEALGGRPSLTVLCGNSEVEQQAAMLGLDPAVGRGELFGELLPELIEDYAVDALYVPSSPCGGELPFRSSAGIANYYGVGGYRRGLEDVRRSEVLFAGECLAFSNVPEAEALDDLLGRDRLHPPAHHPAWKAGVPRDNGAGWDFEDVRDHYLAALFAVDPAELRMVDHDRYLELSRLLTGEVMSEVFGEWRRAGSPCGGGLVLWLADLHPGAGWGLLDHRGEPKAAFHHLRRALSPVALWTVDEGLGGIDIHLANDRREALQGRLRIALYSGGERRVGEDTTEIALPPHSLRSWNVETLLGRFVDASWAFRFGPAAQDAIVASLTSPGVPNTIQTVRFPAGRPLRREQPEALGLTAEAGMGPDRELRVELACERLAYGVRLHAPGYDAADQWFTLEPGHRREIALAPRGDRPTGGEVWIAAANMHGRVGVTPPT